MAKPKGRQPHTLLKNIHSGKDIWVLASGPSMNYIDPSFFENKLTIGVNRIATFLKCDYVVTKDSKGFEKIAKNLGNGSLIVSKHRFGELPSPETELDCGHYYFTHPNKPNEEPILECVGSDDIVVSWSTVTSAIHIAAYMGARNIIVCGHDCGTIDGEAMIKGYYNESLAPEQGAISSYVDWVSNKIEAHTVALKKRVKEVYGANVYSLNPFINFNLEGHEFRSGDSHSDCVIVIAVHNHVARFGFPCLKSVLEHSGDARVYLYDNESSDPDIQDLKSFANDQPTVDFIRIDDQKAFGGLTGTWNDGINRARRDGLKKVILLNHDVVVGNTWSNFINAIDSDYCIYGPLTDNPGGGEGNSGIQHAESAENCGLLNARELLGFCIGFTLGRPDLKLFDDWRFFDPKLPFGNNEFGIQERMKKRSNKSRFYVVTNCWVHHRLNMGWKDSPKYPDLHDPAPKRVTQFVRSKNRGFSRTNYLTGFEENNIFHILLKEILSLCMADLAELRASDLYIVDNRIDISELNQLWRMFVLSNIFHHVEYIRKDETGYISNPIHFKTGPSYQHYEFIASPPRTEFIRLCESIRKNAGIDIPGKDYVLLNQRPERNRYLMESETVLPLQEYLRCALDERGIPFRSCDFSVMTPADQAQQCSGARIFISAHGAGISNTIFTPQHCHVLEYNFRKYWNCHPVCDAHFHGVLADHEECDGELTEQPYFHKADYHNLCRLMDRPYTELEVVRYDGYRGPGPIDRRYLFVDGASLLAEIEKQASC